MRQELENPPILSFFSEAGIEPGGRMAPLQIHNLLTISCILTVFITTSYIYPKLNIHTYQQHFLFGWVTFFLIPWPFLSDFLFSTWEAIVSNNSLIPLSYFALVNLNIALCYFANSWAYITETVWFNKSILFPTIATTRFSGPFYFSSYIQIFRPSNDSRFETSYTTIATLASL